MDPDSPTTPSRLPGLPPQRSLLSSAAPQSPASHSSSHEPLPSHTSPSPPAPSSSPSPSGLSFQRLPPSPRDASRATTSRSVRHWPWRPNVYARLKIQGHILPVKLAEVTSTPPPDRPLDYGGAYSYNARFWACVYIDELDYCWWAFTVAIIILDEILRHPVHEDVLAPATAETISLVEALRALRDAVASDENYGGSRLWLPLSSGKTLDEAISRTHVCVPQGDSFHEVLYYSRNSGFFKNGLNALIDRAHHMCKNLHASSEHLYFGDLPQGPMSRVEAYINSGGRDFEMESKDLRFFRGILGLVMTQQGFHQFQSPALERSLSSRPAHEVVGSGAYGQVFKVTHPYWGDLAVKVPLPHKVLEQEEFKELGIHTVNNGHRNILPVVAWTFHESRIVVAMQCAENGSLDTFLAKNTDSSRILILISIATALQQLHESNRIHGDIHMGNIVISKDGEAFLCDFGLSKEVDDKNAQDDAAGGNAYGGVLIYTAPELHKPGAHRTFASEVFAFGMVMFHAYTGNPPFVLMVNNQVARYPAAIIKAIANGRRPTRDQVTRVDFSDGMWNLVQDCWRGDPALRPSMAQVSKRMAGMVPFEDKMKFLMRVTPVELTLFRPGDGALDDAMLVHEKSAQLRWTLSRMEHFGLKTFFIDHIDARDAILMETAYAMLAGPRKLMDVEECDIMVLIRLHKVIKDMSSKSD